VSSDEDDDTRDAGLPSLNLGGENCLNYETEVRLARLKFHAP
jgi:hypothetical protein